jgi:MoaA/NifB/PqqE/SkfB family radical SAM enzyme
METLERLVDVGVEKISYSGGEPMEFPNFDKVVQRGNALGLIQIVTTNGDQLVHGCPTWLRYFEYVKLSFYGNETLHDLYMTRGHYKSQMELSKKLHRDMNIIVSVNYMVTSKSQVYIPEFLNDCVRASIDNIMFQTYILNGRSTVDSRMKLLDPERSIENVRELSVPFSGKFLGGIKVHDYTRKDWFMVLTPDGMLTLPSSDGTPDFCMGSIFDNYLMLPNCVRVDPAEALERIWSIRNETDAIIVIDEGIAR